MKKKVSSRFFELETKMDGAGRQGAWDFHREQKFVSRLKSKLIWINFLRLDFTNGIRRAKTTDLPSRHPFLIRTLVLSNLRLCIKKQNSI